MEKKEKIPSARKKTARKTVRKSVSPPLTFEDVTSTPTTTIEEQTTVVKMVTVPLEENVSGTTQPATAKEPEAQPIENPPQTPSTGQETKTENSYVKEETPKQEESNPILTESFESSAVTPPSMPANEPKVPESYAQTFPQEYPGIEKTNRKLFLFGAIGAVAIISASIFFLLLSLNNASNKEKMTQEETTTFPTEIPVTPSPKLNRTAWELEVLNGSGVSGAAAKAADQLTQLGYTVGKVGNADNSNYKATSLYVSKDNMSSSGLFLEDIKKKFTSATIAGELKNSTFSARIILGKE